MGIPVSVFEGAKVLGELLYREDVSINSSIQAYVLKPILRKCLLLGNVRVEMILLP